MKASSLFPLLAAAFSADAFAPSKGFVQREQTTLALFGGNEAIDRRAFGEGLAFVAGSAFLPAAAHAEYKPKIEDLKQIYGLGVSLDALAEKIADESKRRRDLDGLHSFNKDAGFFPSYARNYVGKLVKRDADGDRRNDYIKEAAGLISSCEGLLEGQEGLTGKDAGDEAVRRVRSAQSLISKFLAESGVEDERVATFVAAHP